MYRLHFHIKSHNNLIENYKTNEMNISVFIKEKKIK